MRHPMLLIATVVAACGAGSDAARDAAVGDHDTPADSAPDGAGPITFHCGFTAACPEFTIAGDPKATSAFRGYGDPSLEQDPAGALWMSYSWLDQQTPSAAGAPINTVRTHLARSDDGGATWRFVRAINTAGPTPGNDAEVLHEVSTLVRRPDGTWEDAWLTYAQFPGVGGPRAEFHYRHTIAATPAGLGASEQGWLRGSASTIATELTAAAIPGVEDCAVFTEPALFTLGDASYLATSCVVDGTPATQRLVLLRARGAGLELVGDLLTHADAVALGATRVEQLDLAVGRDGAVLAIVTPIDDAAAVPHQGCVVLEVADLATATMKRVDGALVKRAVITGEGGGLGPGLCTYDRATATGVVMTLIAVDALAGTAELTLHATGVHP
ncbi:MAG: hypothetical protein R3B06_13855 [Kofleriaceae bacterium]